MRKPVPPCTPFVGSSVLLIASLFSACNTSAQTAPVSPPPAATLSGPGQGSLSGHVFLSDTNGPARFAHVLLKRVPDGSTAKPGDPGADLASLFGSLLGAGGDDDDDDAKKPAKPAKPAPPKKEDPDAAAASGAFAQIMASANDLLTSATVDAGGAYSLTGLKPGTYFVHAILPGYVDPLAAFSPMDLASKDPTMQQRIHSSVQTITVTGNSALHQDIRLELGAAVSGHVLFDDGSPAVGWHVSVAPVVKDAPPNPMGFSQSELPSMTDMLFKETHITDDRGSYRVAGLPAGDYIVSATLQTSNASGGSALTGGQMQLTVLSGNVTRQQDAKPVTLGNGEDRKGEDLILPLSKLHSISGLVVAKLDGHPANSGSVQLRDDAETSVLKMQTASIQPDGTFRFDYVGNGHYTVKIKQAAITERTGKSKKIFGMDIPDEKTLRSFGPGEQKAAVADSDVTGLTFSLPEVPVPSKDDK